MAGDHQSDDTGSHDANGHETHGHDAHESDVNAHDTAAPQESVLTDEAAAETAASPLSVMGATAPRRTKSIIEAEAIRTGEAESASDTVSNIDDHAAETVPKSETATEAGEPAAPASTLPPMSEPPRRRGSFWPLAAAIIIGAAIAAGGAYGLHQLDKTGPSLADLKTRVAALEQTTANVAALQSNVTTLGQKLDALTAKSQTTDTSLADTQQRLQALEEAVKQLPKQSPATGGDASGTSPSAAAAPAVDLGPLTGRVDKLEQQLAALDQRVGALASKFQSDLEATQADIKAAQAQKDATAQAVMSHADADARAILAGTLRRKVEIGDSFADELSALATHGADKDRLAVLAPFAASGVPTPQMLSKEFASVRPDILATQAETKPDGFFARLVQDAKHLVRIRKVGDMSGTDLSAQSARIQAALAGNRLDDALREWNALPASAKAKSQSFAEALRHRIAAVDAAKAIEADALAALAKVKS